MTRRLRSILLLSLLLLSAAAIAGVARPREGRAADTPATAARTVTVTGSGSVTTVPDRASFDFTVETQAATAQAALARNATAAAAMIAAIKNAGVADGDLQTGQVALSLTTSPGNAAPSEAAKVPTPKGGGAVTRGRPAAPAVTVRDPRRRRRCW